MRRCCRCKMEQPLDQFCKDRQRKDGLSARCKTCRSELTSAWQKANPDKAYAKFVRYKARHPDRVGKHQADWRARNPDYSAEANRKWREANPGADAAYHQANREKTMERVLRRRKKIAETMAAPIDFAALWDAQDGICGLCGGLIDRDLRHPDPMSPSVDHIVPLSKGGHHSQDNLQWAHLRCNLSKGARVS